MNEQIPYPTGPKLECTLRHVIWYAVRAKKRYMTAYQIEHGMYQNIVLQLF